MTDLNEIRKFRCGGHIETMTLGDRSPSRTRTYVCAERQDQGRSRERVRTGPLHIHSIYKGEKPIAPGYHSLWLAYNWEAHHFEHRVPNFTCNPSVRLPSNCARRVRISKWGERLQCLGLKSTSSLRHNRFPE